ncbi:MAG: DUF418 domain-containing protein [Flavobacteriaceae bacterium]|nr:DUF418 domain-containing protein [Flavobacteriaceae bacterium]
MENDVNPQPTRGTERISLLDVYRGFAIFGIFVVNIVIMNSTFLNQDEFAKQWTSAIDQFSERILQLFFYTKFFPIFSLLFGLGIAMQAVKLKENGNFSFSFFGRRMFILFLIGALHIIFLWSGDVLNLYALLGLLVTVSIKRSNKLILSLALFFILFPFYDPLFQSLFELFHFRPESFLAVYDGAEVNRIISRGSYMEGMVLRLREYMANIPMLFGYLGPMALSMFLLGLYLGKNKIYNKLETFIDRIKKPLILLTLVTNAYRLIFLFLLPGYEWYSNPILRPYLIKAMIVSDVLMGLFYLWLIGWLWYKTKFRFVLNPLKYAGRMALTNYIAQSVIGLFLFSSLGLSLYETFSPSQSLLIAMGVFCFQVLYSKLWLSYFKYGPLEWAWRCLTYKKYIPLRKKREVKPGYIS